MEQRASTYSDLMFIVIPLLLTLVIFGRQLWLAACLLLLVAVVIFGHEAYQRVSNRTESKKIFLPIGFDVARKFIGKDGVGIAVDGARKKLCLINGTETIVVPDGEMRAAKLIQHEGRGRRPVLMISSTYAFDHEVTFPDKATASYWHALMEIMISQAETI